MFALVPTLLRPDFPTLQRTWLSNVPKDLVAGLVVALALIPEAIAFSIIAGVAPQVGLYASFSIAVITSIFGGRPAMISAATAAIAVLFKQITNMDGISEAEALNLIFAATILGGIFQMIAGWLRLGSLMRFVSRSVIVGFVNALAILIFLAQVFAIIKAMGFDVDHWTISANPDKASQVTALTFLFIALGLGVIYLLPLIARPVTAILPPPLIAILGLTALSLLLPGETRWTVGDEGTLPEGLPSFIWLDWAHVWQHGWLVLSVAVSIMVVGLLESLMTASIVEDATETPTQRNRECMGQGLANVATGFLGGMGGCAMIGQSIINVKSGGRGRLSCFAAGLRRRQTWLCWRAWQGP